MEIEYRKYQQRSINKALEHFRNGDKAVLLEAPVGSGKTIMGLQIVKSLMEESAEKLTCAWVAPRHYLLKQLMESNPWQPRRRIQSVPNPFQTALPEPRTPWSRQIRFLPDSRIPRR